jgi:DNA-binding XRE family transcriptional regulator
LGTAAGVSVEVGQKRTWDGQNARGIWFAFITNPIMDSKSRKEVIKMKDLKTAIFTEEEIKIAKFQSNLTEILKLYDISPARLGKILGISRQQVYNIQNGNTKMNKMHYIAIMASLAFGDKEIEQIFNDSKKARLLNKEVELKEMKERLET